MLINGPVVLILGSGPNAVQAGNWPKEPFERIVAINNAWTVRDDWDFAIHPEDFAVDRRPSPALARQRIVTHEDYIPAQNRFGGVIYAGGTMAFTAGYWALAGLRPSVMAFMGCDMVYPASGHTHFYGTGTPDPLRADVTLQSLEAKSARLFLLAAAMGCACVNLSSGPSRLVLPHADRVSLADVYVASPGDEVLLSAKSAEADLGHAAPTGRYWEIEDQLDAAALARIDELWLNAFSAADTRLRERLHENPAPQSMTG
ncbi:MAG: hypothetical protein AAF367_04890 [Pseudomonadota bacterium]